MSRNNTSFWDESVEEAMGAIIVNDNDGLNSSWLPGEGLTGGRYRSAGFVSQLRLDTELPSFNHKEH